MKNISTLILLFSTVLSTKAQDLKYVHPTPIGDDLSCVAIVPGTTEFFALADETHTVVTSKDFGESVEMTFPFHNDKTSAFHDIVFINDQIGLLAKNGEIRRTEDGGKTWSIVHESTFSRKKIEANENGYAVAISAFDLTYSTDFGATWSSDRDFDIDDFIEDVSLLPDGKVFVAGSKGLYMISEDGGESWNGFRFNDEPNLVHIEFANENVGFIQGFLSSFTVYTKDGGANWLFADHPGFFSMDDLLMDDQGTLWGINQDELFSSSDTGAVWQSVYEFEDNFFDPQGDELNMALKGLSVDGNRMVVCGWGGQLLVSNDAGTSWDMINDVVSDDAIWDIRQYGNEVMTVGQDGTVMFSMDGGASWSSEKFSAFEFQFVERFADGTWIVGGNNGAVHTTPDFGQTWSDDIGPGGDDDITGGAILPDQSVIVIGEDGTIRKSTDQGNSWIDIVSPFTDESANFISGIDFFDSEIGVISGSTDQVYKTLDGGITWEDISIGSENPRTMRFVQTISADTIIVAGDSEVFRSVDGGVTYEVISNRFLTSKYFNESGQGIASGSGNVYKTTDFGQNWEVITNKAERSLNQSYVSETGDMWLVGFRGIIWNDKEVFGPISTSQFKLADLQPVNMFPNPSYGEVNISLENEVNGPIKVQAFDLLGTIVFESSWLPISGKLIQVSMPLESGSYIVALRNNQNELIARQQIQFIK